VKFPAGNHFLEFLGKWRNGLKNPGNLERGNLAGKQKSFVRALTIRPLDH